jgi:protein O-mannosyl-transferase
MQALRPTFLIAWLGAVALFAAAYSNSLHNAFHFDDDHVIERNPYLRDLAHLPRFFTDAHTFSALPQNATYRPVLSASLALDHALGDGLRPLQFHLTQLALLLAVGVLFFFVGRRLLQDAFGQAESWHGWAALFAATLFCVHTGNTQVGNYISARSELLCALGLLGAFALYLHAPRLRPSHLFLVPMVLGALAKPPAVLFAPLLLGYKLLLEPAHPDRTTKTLLRGLWPTFAVATAAFVFVEWMNPPAQTYGGQGRLQYLWTQAFVWVRYVGLFVYPTGLSADTDWALLPTWWDLRVLAGVALLLGSAVGAVLAARAAWRPGRLVAFGILWFWLAIAPTSSFIPLAEVTNDHRPFLGFLGLCLALAAVLFERARALGLPRAVGAMVAVAVLVGHGVGTHLRNQVWRDEGSLWTDVVTKSPANGRGWMNHGLTLMKAGQLQRARAVFLHARTLAPDYALLEVNLGIVHGALGEQDAAEAYFTRALALAPETGAPRRYYARWLIGRGRGPEALAQLSWAVALEPSEPTARRLHLDLLAAKGSLLELAAAAEAWLGRANDPAARAHLEGRPPFRPERDDAVAWYSLGWELTGAGRHAEAAQAWRATLARAPDDAPAWNNLGWSLQALGFDEQAQDAYRHALARDPSLELARNNLAALLQARGYRESRPMGQLTPVPPNPQ